MEYSFSGPFPSRIPFSLSFSLLASRIAPLLFGEVDSGIEGLKNIVDVTGTQDKTEFLTT